MKIRNDILFLIVIIFAFLLTNCGPKKGKESASSAIEKKDATNGQVIERTPEEQRSIDAISARTMGLAYLEENKLEDAESEFLKLIELAPNEALGYANLGIVYLRMGKYEQAEEQLERAVGLDPGDPDIRLNLARVYELTDQGEASKEEMEKAIETTPDHVQTLYRLAESLGSSAEAHSLPEWSDYMQRVVDAAPTNIVVRLHLVEALLRNDNSDEALGHLEEIGRIYPELPEEAREFYNKSIEDIRTGNIDDALVSVLTFHNFLKLTNPYQAGIQELKGTGGGLIGTPVITFSKASPGFLMEGMSIIDALYFTDATEAAGLNLIQDIQGNNEENRANPHLALGDIDMDGDVDLYLGSYDSKKSVYARFLLRNNLGRFTDIAKDAQITHSGVESSSIFVDYDNDGFLDLFIAGEDQNFLYENVSEGEFIEISGKTGIKLPGQVNKALFFDMDHEGDLDLFLATDDLNVIYRNNADGTFMDVSSKSVLKGIKAKTRDAAFGDFDDDGDIDLVVINQDGSNALYTNLRQGVFRDVTEESGLKTQGGSGAVTVGDYNNDGYLDLFITGLEDGNHALMQNKGDGTFVQDENFAPVLDILGNTIGYDAAFFDVDNDGYLDLLVSGESKIEGGKGVHLFHNDGKGVFNDITNLLPPNIITGRQIALADYNQDGDMDIFITGLNGGVKLLRNDGGNANHHLKVQLVGIRTGSGKNNYFGIGAKVEIRAGYLYQVRVVTEPTIYFGLGNHEKADVVRILWTNGVPQNIFSPGSDQDLIEEQQLKGSCPFLYTWNGREYTFVKDMMWRSALGMPMGIMGGTTAYAFPNASDEYIKVPGEMLKPDNGRYKIQITSELWETIYFDKIRLIAVDHPASVDIYVDERFVPPPFPELKIYSVPDKIIPEVAVDGKGNDLVSVIAHKDDRYVSNFNRSQYQGITEMHDLVLDLGEKAGTDKVHLFLNGWIFPTDASINVAISQTSEINSISPYLQVINKEGEWETVIDNIGFPMGKDKTVVVDLSGKFLTSDRKIRIRTNMEIYWDHVFFSNGQDDMSIRTTRIKPLFADLHYRGFSRMFRKGGRYGPHWFDYKDVALEPQWRDLPGQYTRYGDVLDLLAESDNMYAITNAGDETSIEFDATTLPLLPDGWTRDFVIYSVGWVKDGDLNTATGNMVEPLPYHGISRYPYGEGDVYPDKPELQKYRREYNTRKVN